MVASLRRFFPPWSARAGGGATAGRLKKGRRRVAPTRYGLLYLGMLAAFLLGALNNNNNLGYLLTFLLGSIAFVSLFHTVRNLAGISLVSARARPVFAGQPAVFHVVLAASSHFRPAISLQFPGAAPARADLPAESKITVDVAMETRHRGVLAPASLAVSTVYPLGLFRARCLFSVDATCLVYPKPVAGPLVRTPGPAGGDSDGETGGAGVDDFSGLQAYQPGDPLQYISWKAFSRGQGLHTKKFEGQQGKPVYFNPDSLPGRDHEWKLSRICYMILQADGMRLAYGLQLGSLVMGPEEGEEHKRHCLRALALEGRRGP